MFNFVAQLLTHSLKGFDEKFKETPAHQIVLATAALYFLWQQYPVLAQTYRARHNTSYKQRLIDAAYNMAKNLPQVKQYIDKELEKNLQSIKEKVKSQRTQMLLQNSMPEKSIPAPLLLKEFDINIDDCTFDFNALTVDAPEKIPQLQKGDGQDSGALYVAYSKELIELLKEVYAKTNLTNPMQDKWPRINAMQAEVIRWCQILFNGSEESYGLITHGGTTSIIEAMAAYVLDARARGITCPEIVVPETTHAAFKKAADLTGAILITVPVNKTNGAVTAAKMRQYISKNTAVMVGSAPSFMNGIHDPIDELGQLAQEKKIPFHVDACLGGFLTAFKDTSDNPMDFRVPGVTSISADFHKYGYCPKGTSICLFSKDSPALSVYAALNWQGGLYATPGILDGSTSGSRVAEIYTVLSYFGRQKYQEISERIIDLRQRLQARVSKLNDIYIFGNPQWSVLGFRSDTLNSHLIADELDKRGWKLNFLQNPDGFHLCLTHVHTLVPDFENKFIHDLCEAILDVKNYPADKKPSGNVKVYGAVGMMPTGLQKLIGEQYQKIRLTFQETCKGLGFFASIQESSETSTDKQKLYNNTM